MMTVSRRPSVGARHCSTYARKVGPFIAPSITKGATMPLWRKPATKVVVFQCPCGTDATSRSPRRQRPLSLTMLVLVAVSSINTSRAGSSMPCSRIQRRRARATSARFCSAACRLFFEADIVSIEKALEGAPTAGDTSLGHRGEDLLECQIGLLGNQSQEPVRVLFQRRSTPSALLCLGASCIAPALTPSDCRANAQLEHLGRFPAGRPAFNRIDHAFTQVSRIRFRHRSGSHSESISPDSPTPKHLGIPPIQCHREML